MWGFYFLKYEPFKTKMFVEDENNKGILSVSCEKFLLCTFQYILQFIYKSKRKLRTELLKVNAYQVIVVLTILK